MALSLLWEQCIAAFLKDVFVSHSNSDATIDSYAYVLRSFLRHADKAPELCTREDVVSYMASPNVGRRNHGQPPSPGTRNLRKVIVHQFYTFATRYTCYDGYGLPYKLFQGDNPADGLHHTQEEPRPRFLTTEETRAFFAAIDTNTLTGKLYYAFFLTLLASARRKTEIAELTWGNLAYGIVTDGQGNREGWTYRFRGKGRQTWDEAELPEAARVAIWEYLEASGRLSTIEPDDYIFRAVGPRCGGGPRDPYARISTTAIQRATKRYATLAGIDPAKVTVHAFRHTSAKHRLDLGQDFFAINRLLRHKSIDMTHRYCQALRVSGDPEAQRLMEHFGL